MYGSMHQADAIFLCAPVKFCLTQLEVSVLSDFSCQLENPPELAVVDHGAADIIAQVTLDLELRKLC